MGRNPEGRHGPGDEGGRIAYQRVAGSGRALRQCWLTIGQFTMNPAAVNFEPPGPVIMPWSTKPVIVPQSSWRVFRPAETVFGVHSARCTSHTGLYRPWFGVQRSTLSGERPSS